MPRQEATHVFAHMEQVARESGIPAKHLQAIFELETAFHKKILATPDAAQRRLQYSELYNAVHALQTRTNPHLISPHIYRRLVLLFRAELMNKSVLDVGCGRGEFLAELARILPHGDLVGLDTSSVQLLAGQELHDISFVNQDITSFHLGRQFDVVFSHQVLEHIAPADFLTHIRSVHAALAPSGKFIVLLPNKYWGPHDITQIIDNTCTGRLAAAGSHLNESSFSEMVPLLESYGFINLQTILPFAAFIPPVRRIRVKPLFHRLIERKSLLRWLISLPRRHGKPWFKNHVVLICQKRQI